MDRHALENTTVGPILERLEELRSQLRDLCQLAEKIASEELLASGKAREKRSHRKKRRLK